MQLHLHACFVGWSTCEKQKYPPRPPAQAFWGLAKYPPPDPPPCVANGWNHTAFGVHFPPARLILPHLSVFVFWTPSLLAVFFAFFGPPRPPPPPSLPCPLPTQLGPGDRQVTFGAVETPVFLPQTLGFCCGHAPTLPSCVPCPLPLNSRGGRRSVKIRCHDFKHVSVSRSDLP